MKRVNFPVLLRRGLLTGLSGILLLSGCIYADSVTVRENSLEKSRAYYDVVRSESEDLSFDTVNFLRTNLLMEEYESAPDKLLLMLSEKFRRTSDPGLLNVKTDICYHLALSSPRSSSDVRYYVSALIGYYTLLFGPGKTQDSASRFDPIYIRAVTRYNTCLSEVFRYLRKRSLLGLRSFEIPGATGEHLVFQDVPKFHLPLKQSRYSDFIPCSDYESRNLLHFSYHFGIGIPLIVLTKDLPSPSRLKIVKDLARPATCFLRLTLNGGTDAIPAVLEYYDSSMADDVVVAGEKVPLTRDFSTPMAYFLNGQANLNLLLYMLSPAQDSHCGLYAMEPYDPNKIPVVFVHGLMSSPQTWVQLINSLTGDPVIRKKYQFWLFTYSSGNPVLVSASKLRDDLDRVYQFYGGAKNKNLSNMVLVGHSMGGLLSKTMAQNSGDRIVQRLFGERLENLRPKLTEEEFSMLNNYMVFTERPYVRRMLFLAVPHGGSVMAGYGIAQLGISLTRLPGNFVRMADNVAAKVFEGRTDVQSKLHATTGGIANLNPSHPVLCALKELPFSDRILYHSIIGNKKAAGIPGGTDGVVPYSSSHLDIVRSELIVKSGHSVQTNPETTFELARILHEHLRMIYGPDARKLDRKK